MTIIHCAVVFLITSFYTVLSADPDIKRTGPELITSKGFSLEEHFSTTPDGYILRLFRFSNPNISSVNSPKPPVLLQHGLLDSSDTWIVNYRNASLGFVLADAGYDVWLGNTRGNKYSRNHTHLNPNFPLNWKFWAFTFDDMAKYDVPTLIDTVRNATNVSKIPYIGHSQGTTQVFANLAQPQSSTFSVADSLSIFIALAPVTYLHNTKSTLLKVVADLHLDGLIGLLGDREFLPDRAIFEVLLPGICGSTPGICDAIINAICGFDRDDFDNNRLPVFVSHFPSGISVRELEHYAQGIRNANWFKMYNYGTVENEVHYHQPEPPAYSLKNITAPMALFYGGVDDLGDKIDVEQALAELPKTSVKKVYYYKDFGHLDFNWGKNCTTMHKEILNLISTFSDENHETFNPLTEY